MRCGIGDLEGHRAWSKEDRGQKSDVGDQRTEGRGLFVRSPCQLSVPEKSMERGAWSEYVRDR